MLDCSDEVYVPAIVLGELLAGFKKGNAEQRNKEILADFLDVSRVFTLPIDEDSAKRYAVILDYLHRQGAPIPTNDIWIAALAMEHSLVIYTRDPHFDLLPQIPKIR